MAVEDLSGVQVVRKTPIVCEGGEALSKLSFVDPMPRLILGNWVVQSIGIMFSQIEKAIIFGQGFRFGFLNLNTAQSITLLFSFISKSSPRLLLPFL